MSSSSKGPDEPMEELSRVLATVQIEGEDIEVEYQCEEDTKDSEEESEVGESEEESEEEDAGQRKHRPRIPRTNCKN